MSDSTDPLVEYLTLRGLALAGMGPQHADTMRGHVMDILAALEGIGCMVAVNDPDASEMWRRWHRKGVAARAARATKEARHG